MKALILNSGTGSRLKSKATCKCLVTLAPDVTIIETQIAALQRCGIDEIYITTGPHADVLENYIREKIPNAGAITFIHNPLYESTNYIYSMQLASKHLRGSDVLLMHGDLVFEQNVLQDICASELSVMVTDSMKPLPEKDFKAKVRGGRIDAVGTDIFIEAQYAQPLYKLKERDWEIWAGQIDAFYKAGRTGVYAEDALNEVSSQMSLRALDITGRVCFEVDTDEDLAQAREAYKQMPDRLQTVYAGYGASHKIQEIIDNADAVRPFIVCGVSEDTARKLFGENAVYFSAFNPNPDIGEIEAGGELFRRAGCNFIASLGGGSAIDTAKCIKDGYLSKNTEIKHSLKHLAIPTSAGTGSESTQFAAVYDKGVKQSIDKPEFMPDYVILDPFFLETLPEYHRKSTLLDAFCQATESLWAKGKTEASISYARAARRIIQEDSKAYLAGDVDAARFDEDAMRTSYALRILTAANLAGKAINISRTTAAHAMSYKLSAEFGIAHGHAVALCIIPVWKHLINTGKAPPELSKPQMESFIELFESMQLKADFTQKDISTQQLAASVNTERLSNHPAALTQSEIIDMYNAVLKCN